MLHDAVVIGADQERVIGVRVEAMVLGKIIERARLAVGRK